MEWNGMDSALPFYCNICLFILSIIILCFLKARFFHWVVIALICFVLSSEPNGCVYVPCSHWIINTEHPAFKTGSVFVTENHSPYFLYIWKDRVSMSVLRSLAGSFHLTFFCIFIVAFSQILRERTRYVQTKSVT